MPRGERVPDNVKVALSGAEPHSYWLDTPAALPAHPPLEANATTDLLVIGGGLTGLWAALQALEGHPERSVMVLEAKHVAFGASGRNGGFCAASLTHGVSNGMSRWPHEMQLLERMGRENLHAIRSTIQQYDIDCEWEDTGEISVANHAYQLPDLTEEAAALSGFGWHVDQFDGEQMRAQVHSPAYLGGVWLRDGCAMLHPAKLCWGLARAASELGAKIHESTPVVSLSSDGAAVVVRTPNAAVRARRVFLATSAFPPLLRTIRHFIVPVYDYVLVTEPLTTPQREAIGWQGRQGIGDMGNQFHYYRLTVDNRILWGGYDAVYYFGNGMGSHLDQRQQTTERLARHFFATFPQLEGLRFTHRWGGAIDTCSRFSVMFGRAMGGRAAYAAGFTGLGVGASRFGARVALDLLDDKSTERTRLEMVRRKPLPFPPEPLRYAGIQLTRGELARADRNEGRRGPWLRALDRLGMGFDS